MRKVVGRKYQNSKNKMPHVFSACDVCYIFSAGGNKTDFMLSSILPKKENKKKIH